MLLSLITRGSGYPGGGWVGSDFWSQATVWPQVLMKNKSSETCRTHIIIQCIVRDPTSSTWLVKVSKHMIKTRARGYHGQLLRSFGMSSLNKLGSHHTAGTFQKLTIHTNKPKCITMEKNNVYTFAILL